MKTNRFNDLTGSPGFGSPGYDFRNGKRERAAQFGLTDENEESFECNQSFPKFHQKLKHNTFTPDLNRIKGCDLNSVSFLKKSLIKNLNAKGLNNLFNDTLANNSNYISTSCLSTTIDKSWTFYNQFLNSNALLTNNSNTNQNSTQNFDQILTLNNPNKALIVINGRTTEILTANNISCDLYGYNEEKLIGMKLKDLLDLKSDDDKKQEILMESDRLDQNGKIVLCSGKIFDALTVEKCDSESKNIIKIPISMFMLKLTDEQEPKCLCVMEPIQRIVGTFSINVKGRIKNYNSNFSYIFGYTNLLQSSAGIVPSSLSTISATSILLGKDINDLIPSMKLPISGILPELRKQLLTGRSFQGENIPLTVNILNKQLLNEEIVYNCNVNVYTNISGLVTVRPNDFRINSYNSTFSRFLFGYNELELLDKPITYLIPNFFDPETSSSALSRTPLAVNNSYLNTQTGSCSRASLGTNKINMNNGSFLEMKLTPQKKANNKSTQNQHLPTLVVTEVDKNSLEKSNSTLEDQTEDEDLAKKCIICKENILKTKSKPNLLVEFNLDPDEYSPNKKCANYLENMNNFSPSSIPNTPQSSVKKTLLAKAITNNIISNEKSNISLDEVSLQSTCSTASSYIDDFTSPVSSPSKQLSGKDQSFSNLDLSELDILENDHQICEKCKFKKTAEKDNNSDVSLICAEDAIEDDKQVLTKNNKRKASLTSQIESDQNLYILEQSRRRSSIMSDFNSNTNQQIANTENLNNQNEAEKNKKFKNQVTSTPAANMSNNLNSNNSKLKTIEKRFNNNKNCMQSPSKYLNSNDGIYFGRGRHSDGSFIRIFFHKKLIKLNEEEEEEDENLICVWISRDPYSDKSIIDYSLDQSQLHRTHLNNHTMNDVNNYLNEYEDLRTLGRGASGFVQLAKRKLDRFEVVTKYILKSKIYKENWINDERYGNIPLEISILCKLDHTNIIKVLEVFQDCEHVQMVMEKHGCGMDLFEFIDRQRRHIDERLASYIFKQIVSAVSYLHSNNIVHRDIKDENIVINENFHVKLIDFGSAAYVTKGKKFATFCGTMDYCSPDVLLGNKYYGPELDVWTCGIALYTLVFCENPFQSAEETIECILKPPFKVSKELMKLLFSILCPKPELRATIEEIETNEWVNQQVDINDFKWEDVIRDTEFHANDAGDFNRDDDLILKPCDQLVQKQMDDIDLNDEQHLSIKTNQFNQTNLNNKNNIFYNNLLSKSF